MAERIVAQYYHTARTAHVERLAQTRDQRMYLLYTKTRADFVITDGAAAYVRRTHALGVVGFCVRHKVDVLEVAEPYAIKLWPQLLLVTLLVRVLRIFGLCRSIIVTYAIENYSPAKKLSEFTRLPTVITSAICAVVGALLILGADRIVFGTREAQEVYEAQMPRHLRPRIANARLIWHLPAADERRSEVSRSGVLFLGTFERRKGIFELMSAWSVMGSMEAQASPRLTLLGKSGELDKVRRFAAENPESVSLIEDPPRAQIFDELHRAKVLVLLSQPSRGWKEQVGLPIVEGLSAGCEIVSSDETGIAPWLRQHGHEVVEYSSSPETIATAILAALQKNRDVTADLPIIDGRVAASRLMFAPSDD